jgi:hypothetical protein
VSALDFDRMTLDPRDLSYERQLAQLETEGWELEEAAGPEESGRTRYLRRHRRIGDIERLFEANGRKLRLSRDDDGVWTAEVLPRPISAGPDSEITAATPLEAAEAAWQELGPSA